MAPKKKQSNFSIALDQLINGTPAPSEEKTETPVAKPEPVAPVVKPEPVAPVVKPEPVAPVVKPEPVAPKAEPEAQKKSVPTVDPASSQVTVIQNDTIITGSIVSKNPLRVFGIIEGDISTTNELYLSGDVTGRVIAKGVNMTDGVVEGDVNCTGDMVMDSSSLVLGDVSANQMVIDGRVKGNIVVENHLKLNAHSVVAGDITANTIQMDNGASVAGKLTITSEAKKIDDDMFARRKR